jgi:tRNA(Ile)-lysidine synthase
VREWLGYLGVRMPSVKVLQAILQNILTARQEANPIVRHDGFDIKPFPTDHYDAAQIKAHHRL